MRVDRSKPIHGTSATKRSQIGGRGRFGRPKPIRLPSQGDPSVQTKPPIRSVRFRSVQCGNQADSEPCGCRAVTERSQFGGSRGGAPTEANGELGGISTDRSQSCGGRATKRSHLRSGSSRRHSRLGILMRPLFVGNPSPEWRVTPDSSVYEPRASRSASHA